MGRWMGALGGAGACLLLFGLAARASGLYGVWYANHPQVLSLPYLSGGQVMVQWRDIETGPATYNWDKLDSALAAGGKSFSVQVNGNSKPAFLFSLVPCTPNWGDGSASDSKLLMYWHPTFVNTYTAFVEKLAEHLKASPYRSSFLGVRMNFNPIGTEHMNVPPAHQKASTWTVPEGVANGPDWSTEISQSYELRVVDAFINAFGTSSSSIHLFLRANTDPWVLTHHAAGQPPGFLYQDYFRQGTFQLMMTGSELEPRSVANTGEYEMYLKYALPGLTVGYAEPMADAWGGHGGKTDPRWCTPPQWNYWRLLSDLNMGVSNIALYGDDLSVAHSATRKGLTVGADYQAEFDQAFRFAARYAGHHSDAAAAPGAWIAFRQSDKNLPASDYNARVTDYRQYLVLLNPEDTVPLNARKNGVSAPVIANRTVSGEYTIGPYNQRFGAWARSIAAGRKAELQMDKTFLAAVNSTAGAAVNVTYLDNGAGASFTTSFGTQAVVTKLSNSGLWQTRTIPVTSKFVANAKAGHIAITSAGGAVIFHMVEVTKPTSPK
jgi:hypothetical protein